MKRTIAKNTLSFSTSKSMKYLRTPIDIWSGLTQEFNFTIDACASDNNHLLPRYYTKENSCLDKDWTGETIYCHPMFDIYIPLNDDGTIDDGNSIGYIKPLMILIFRN